MCLVNTPWVADIELSLWLWRLEVWRKGRGNLSVPRDGREAEAYAGVRGSRDPLPVCTGVLEARDGAEMSVGS